MTDFPKGHFGHPAGKGGWRRPAAVSRGDWDEKWTRTFGARPAPDPEAETENDQPPQSDPKE